LKQINSITGAPLQRGPGAIAPVATPTYSGSARSHMPRV